MLPYDLCLCLWAFFFFADSLVQLPRCKEDGLQCAASPLGPLVCYTSEQAHYSSAALWVGFFFFPLHTRASLQERGNRRLGTCQCAQSAVRSRRPHAARARVCLRVVVVVCLVSSTAAAAECAAAADWRRLGGASPSVPGGGH